MYALLAHLLGKTAPEGDDPCLVSFADLADLERTVREAEGKGEPATQKKSAEGFEAFRRFHCKR
ncbi:hypothetical protein [Caballeronia insecticola]|uniref:hypothetical protein n=1 Tax=Caballeronia insecticola TaxID=758793 RepID=UPI0003A65C70|nr:hypothetical protein [Caballeronia insecticola]